LWGFFFVLYFFVFFCFFKFFSPLMRQKQSYFCDTISRIGDWGSNTKIIKTETLLHLKLEIYFFIYLFLFLFCIFYFQSSLCLSNDCSANCWLVHYLYLFISLKLFCLFVCCVFSTCLLVFPFSLTS
jgi:hypothetical protein